MADGVLVVSCGMTTPVGLSAIESAASARSRVQRLTEIEWRDSRFKNFTVGIVPEDGLSDLDPDLENPPLSYREARMLRLADVPLQEAMISLPHEAGAIPLLLGMPELQTTAALNTGDFLSRLLTQTKASFDLSQSKAFPQGRASGILAVNEAVELLAHERAEFVLVGGIDSYVDLYILGTLDMHKRVRTDVNPDGFTPAEGAGFMLLAGAEAAKKYGLTGLARIIAGSAGRESGHIYSDEPYLGEGLAETFEGLFAAIDTGPPIGCVYTSFNGEHYWAKEFGVAMLRHRSRFADNYQMEHPAECFGDVGAACGPVMLALACLGIKAGYRRSPSLVCCSSDYGDRAAVLIERV
jgi:3-oxoacyl-[acyl-carrier-protein] synthase I